MLPSFTLRILSLPKNKVDIFNALMEMTPRIQNQLKLRNKAGLGKYRIARVLPIARLLTRALNFKKGSEILVMIPLRFLIE